MAVPTQPTIDILGLAVGVPKGSDYYPAVDTTTFTQSLQGTTQRYSLGALFNFIANAFGLLTTVNVDDASTANYNAVYNNGFSGVNATLTDATGLFDPFLIDGVAGVVNNVYLIKDQTNQAQNGIYRLAVNGDNVSVPWVLMRVPTFNSSTNIINGQIVFVIGGVTQSDTAWQLSVTNPVVVGTSNLIFTRLNNPFVTLLPWIDATASLIMTPNTGYVADSALLVTLSLPTVCPFGSILEITGKGVGGWAVAQNSGQFINFGNVTTTPGVGGSLSSTNLHDSIRMVCTTANTEFNILSCQGNITYV